MYVRDRTGDDIAGAPKAIATLAAATVAFALSRGLPRADVERIIGVRGVELIHPEARLPDNLVPRLWREMVMRLGDEHALAIEMAKATPLTVLGGLAHGAQYASSLLGALELLVRHSRVVADRLRIRIEVRGDEARLAIAHPLDEFDFGRTSEVGLGLGLRVVRELLNAGDSVKRAEFFGSRHGPEQAYMAFFGVPLRFEVGESALIFHTSALSESVSHANDVLLNYVEEYFAGVLARIAGPDVSNPLDALHRAIVTNAANSEFGVTTAAATAGVSLRSAQRTAAKHGVSLQKMVDAVRTDTAKQLLADPTLGIDVVATLLGYSDDRAFRRAFKRWTGQSPSAYRSAREDV